MRSPPAEGLTSASRASWRGPLPGDWPSYQATTRRSSTCACSTAGRQAVVVDQLGVAVLAQEQVAAETAAQAEWIDPEVGQVHQVDRIGQQQIIAVGLGVEVPARSAAGAGGILRR